MVDSPTSSSRFGVLSRHLALANDLMQSTVRNVTSSTSPNDGNIDAKDDNTVPTTPQRLHGQNRGLSLQLLKQDPTTPSNTRRNASNMESSPKLEPSISFRSLPRRSRGLDFSRACTNLHHSTTLAESSPDSSPVVGNKGMAIPKRSGSGYGSPNPTSALWTMSASERVLGTSVGSIAMETSDSSDSDDDMLREEDDPIHMTPQPIRTSFGLAPTQSPGFNPLTSSPGGRRLVDFARRLKIKTRRKPPVSQSPGTVSPPLTRGLDSTTFFASHPRRESLNLTAGQLNLSDDMPQDALGLSHPQVERRVVTRGSNMLPKTKGFARIRAALQEESSPVDTETKHEAAVIRHVRESDVAAAHTAPPSPSVPAVSPDEAMEELNSIMGKPREGASFGQQAMRNSGGPDFWENWDERTRTPPPPFPQRASSIISEDVSIDTASSNPPSLQHYPSHSSPSRSSTPQPMEMRKALGKRRRDDDFDPAMFKRRAVSPGLSHQNSPIVPSSPATRDGFSGPWPAKTHRESSASSSGTPVGMGKRASRVGMQGMTDTNDGLMNMSIEES